MSEEQLTFPELDARIAEFMEIERAKGRDPVIVFDDISGYRVKTRVVGIVSSTILTEFEQNAYKNGRYSSIDEKWITARHARLLLNHLDKENPSAASRESGR
ncbi:hypothetical protein ACTID9_00805 [Brevibacillus fluminis]|uniref:hypothetical protein n=1 Tax=Brevibacillus fluminis TaxID=511487 RepID=UPI003F88BD4D